MAIALLILLGNLLIYFAICLFLFERITRRGTDPPLDELDLSRTHYAPYAARLKEDMAQLRALPSQRWEIRAQDGARLVGHFYDFGFSRTALFVHGYRAFYLSNFSSLGLFLRRRGYNLLMIEQRGHGESGGRRITLGALEEKDLACWLAELSARRSGEPCLVCGLSMGGHTVARFSDRMPAFVRALVVDCGFRSPLRQITRLARPVFGPFAPLIARGIDLFARLFAHASLAGGDTVQAFSRCRTPTFFLHTETDRVVSPDDTLQNYRACAARKELFLSPASGHAVGFLSGGAPLEKALSEFLTSCDC